MLTIAGGIVIGFFLIMLIAGLVESDKGGFALLIILGIILYACAR